MSFICSMIAAAVIASPPQDTLADFIASKMPARYPAALRGRMAKTYATRIRVEAKRRSLNPIALAVIAWIESDFQPWANGVPGRRAGELGVWQLIPRDTYVSMAWKRIAGCKAPSGLAPWQARRWARYAREFPECEDQAIASERKSAGPWNPAELKDPTLGTYVAAFEIRSHVDASVRAGRPVTKLEVCDGLPPDLPRYGHFNSGARMPPRYYVFRICHRYRLAAKAVLPTQELTSARSRGTLLGNRVAERHRWESKPLPSTSTPRSTRR